MTTEIISPDFLQIEDWRRVVKNNQDIRFIHFIVASDETWLPTILRDAGFFPSNSEIKKNRSDLWRERVPGFDRIKLKWAVIDVIHVSDVEED